MKLRNIFTSVLMSAMAFGTVSCDYLDVVPVEQPSVDNTMDNYTQALGYLYQCYRGVTQPIAADWSQGFNVYNSQPIPGSYQCDLTNTTDEWMMDPVQFNQGILAQSLYTNSVSGANNYNEYNTYNIWMASTFVFLEKLETIGIPKGIVTLEEAKEWKAEAKFLIAYYHFCLLRRYGPIAIVENRLPMNAPISAFPGRMHYDYCVNWICDKLDEAAKDLPVRRQSAETGRATSLICKALKARILLYAASPLFNGQFPFPDWTNNVETPGYGTELVSKTYDRSKWERAKKASEEALALALGEGQRALYQGGGAETADMVNVSYFPVDNLDETFIRKVLTMRNVVCAKESEGNHENIWASPDMTAGKVFMYKARMPHNVIPKSTALPQGYTGFGTIGIPVLFSNRFLTVNGLQPDNDPNFPKESEWLKSAGYKDDGEKLRSHIINLFKNREPRFYAWVAFDGGDYGTLMYNGQHPVYMNMLSKDAQGYNSASSREACPTGIGTQKWIDPKANVTLTGNENFFYAPRPYLRLAELYLNLAECNAELGNTTDALENINIIRRRAGATELTAAKVNQSGKSLVEWARDERAIELFDEIHRYFDIRRWCKGEYIGTGKRFGLQAYVDNPTFEQFNTFTQQSYADIYQWDDRMYLYPIADKELYSNPQFVQSPGY